MRKSGRYRVWALIVAIIIVLVIIVTVGYRGWKEDSQPALTGKIPEQKPLPRMANLPPKTIKPKPPAPSYPPDAPILEQARKALRDGIGPDEAVKLAKSFPEHPERADAAFLLLEYVAEEGNPEAALAVARFYDPAHEGPSGTIRKDAANAYEWYQKALAGRQEGAETHLEKLRQWLQEQAEQGSGESRELLKKWK